MRHSAGSSLQRGRSDEVPALHLPSPTLSERLYPRGTSSHSKQKYKKTLDYDTHAGAEPGVDPRRRAANAEYSHFKEDCIIDVIDYDDEDVSFERMGNEQFIKFLDGPGRVQPGVVKGSEDDQPPQAVRWINIEGIDWKVLSSVALRYNLDALALEDVLYERGHNHSKADYYPNHLFLRILCHTLETPPSYVEIESFERLDSLPADSPDALAPARLPSYNAAEQGGIPVGVLIPNHVKLDSPPPDSASIQSFSSLKPYGSTGQEPNRINIPSSPGSKGEIDEECPIVPPPKRSRGLPSWGRALRRRLSSLSGYHNSARKEQEARLKELKKDHRVEVRKEPMFIFLLTNGTVISIHPSPDNDYTAPISERLHHSDSVLRISADASLLVESLIDLIVDRILEVMDEYQMKIGELEREILISPGMEAVRSLHILSGDLITHKRTLDPIKTMIFGLRKYDLDRCIALHENLAIDKREEQARAKKKEHAKEHKKGKHHKQNKHGGTQRVGADLLGGGTGGLKPGSSSTNLAVGVSPQGPPRPMHSEGGVQGMEYQRPTQEAHVPMEHDLHHEGSIEMRARMAARNSSNVHGFLSYKSKVYLADVYDHMEFALTSLDMFADTTQNLINYAFNIASYNMNIVMSRLTLITIIFLPLTLLTGYFGMNFEEFNTLKNSDAYFWKLAAPVMVVLIPLFMISDIKETYKSWRRRRQDHLAIKEMRRAMTKGTPPGSVLQMLG